ncbi:uncharacterized protein LOC132702970 [Cylas formicarius]|uniref:uncharacterized protein LOC132702970 n=1 Tax=Cylas formicarius TaxID=197179 RepID=UPI002958DB80|nr:uncharacterized protein LOC132702970 [Cylas formicarius]
MLHSTLEKCQEVGNLNLTETSESSKSDLDQFRRYLDFRFNPDLRSCKLCSETTRESIKVKRTNFGFRRRKKSKHVEIRDTAAPVLKICPEEVVFHNCKSGETSSKTIKIINVHSELDGVSIIKLPKASQVTIEFGGGKLAPGMSLNARVFYTQEGVSMVDDEAIFKSTKGDVVKVKIRSTRDPPKLYGYIYKTIEEGTFFAKVDQSSQNLSINCGSCFVTKCVPLTLILKNVGYGSRFLMVSKENWLDKYFSMDSNELQTSSFLIRPAYFELGSKEILEICIIFHPQSCGTHIESLYLISDSNYCQPLEIFGNAVYFTRGIISVFVNPSEQDIAKSGNHCIFLGRTSVDVVRSVTLEIFNNSPMFLKFFIGWGNKCDHRNNAEWIKMGIEGNKLVPFGCKEILLYVYTDKLKPGYNCVHLALFISDVPVISLNENEYFLVSTKEESLENAIENRSNVDVQCIEVEIACCMDTQSPSRQPELKTVEHNKLQPPIPTIVFSKSFLEFGTVPEGIDYQGKLFLRNLSSNEVRWSLVELSYYVDRSPYMEIERYSNLSSDEGYLKPGGKHCLIYRVVNKSATQHLSILILYSEKDGELKAEDACLVTYEIVKQNVVIKTNDSDDPVITPGHILYTDVPVIISIELKNLSTITGCFYFLKHVGKDANKISIKYKPLFGRLGPSGSKRVDLKVTCHDLGIFEEIYIRCFVGCGQEILLTKLICLVDCIHVNFHLPTDTAGYKKIPWPPKVVYEGAWNDCRCKEDIYCEETPINIQELLNEDGNVRIHSQSADKIDTHLKDLKFECLKENVVRIYDVPIKKPHKMTFCIENITPKVAGYTIKSTNFSAKEKIAFDMANKIFQKLEDILEPMLSEYGILIYVETDGGSLGAFEFIPINVLIYSNTFGTYVEDIVVDIDNVIYFEFSVIVEVVGCPLYLPMFQTYTTYYPTLRLGSLLYNAEDVKRKIDILNISSIPLRVIWHTFLYNSENDEAPSKPFNVVCNWLGDKDSILLDFTERYFGTDCSQFIQVIPSESYFSNCSNKLNVTVLFKPSKLEWFNYKKMLTCFLLGRILLDGDSRQKLNYYYRKPEPIIIAVTVKLEIPYLDVEIKEEDKQLHIFANDILLHNKLKHDIQCRIRNDNNCGVEVHLKTDEPYYLAYGNTRLKLAPSGWEIISMFVAVSHDQLLKWAIELYRPARSNENDENLQVEKFDRGDKILTMRSYLNIYYNQRLKDEFPLFLHLHYPNIAVKPDRIKFGYILTGSTVQGLLSIFNLTGSEVTFHMFKSCPGSAIAVIPDSGRIDRSTGSNHSFINITVCFTPSESRAYRETIRVITNIPECYMDVAVEGCGSCDEKFVTYCIK